MNVFIAGWAAGGGIDDAPARAALARLRRHLPFGESAQTAGWRSGSGSTAVICAAHPSAALGGIDYWRIEDDRMALFCGRPILWDGESADGAAALEPARYLQPPSTWIDAIDGRFAIVRAEAGAQGDELLVHPDPLGSYPVYERSVGTARWISNSAAALALIGPRPELDRLALASMIGCGWSLGGGSAWEGIRRLPRGSTLRLSRDGGQARDVLPTSALAEMFGGEWDPDAASRVLAASVGAASGWPARPTTLSLTGGRDSRVVLAAAVSSGAEVLAETGSEPRAPGNETLDVTIARRLCALTGTPHHLNIGSPTPLHEYRAAIESHPYLSHGVVSMSDVLVLARPQTLKVRLTGHGGELARVTHFHPRGLGRRTVGRGLSLPPERAAASIFRNSVKFLPRPVLSGQGRELVRDYLVTWARERATSGVGTLDLGTLFYLEERMANWAAPIQTMYEYAGDTFSPLWSRRLLAHQLGCPEERRLEGAFAHDMVRRLAPEVASVPYESDLARRTLAGRGRRFLTGRLSRPRRRPEAPPSAPRPPNGLRQAVAERREAILSAPRDHPAWDLLDARRVGKLLERDPTSLDARARHHLWRVITAFSSDLA